MPDNVDVFLNLFIKAQGAGELSTLDNNWRNFIKSVNSGSGSLRNIGLVTEQATLKFQKLEDKLKSGKISTKEFEIEVRKLQETVLSAQTRGLNGIIGSLNAYDNATKKVKNRGPLGKLLGLDLHTSIYQLSAFYYLISNVVNQLQRATEKTLEYARSVETLTAQTGLSTQSASAYTLASQQLGINTDTVQEALRTFSDRLGRATGLFGEPTKGSKDMARAMKELGISTLDANGNVRSLEDLLPEIFNSFQKLGPGIKATAVATALFGQRADEMIPLLIRGSANIDKMRERAEALGLILSPDRTERLRELTEALNDVSLAGQSMFQVIAEGLAHVAPAISEAAFFMAAKFREAFVNIQAGFVGIRAETEAFLTGKPNAREIGLAAGTAFAKSQGFVPNPEFDRGRSISPFVAGPGTNEDFFANLFKPAETEDEDADKTAKKLITLNKKVSDLNRDFALDSIKRARDFRRQQQQELEDFNDKQLQAVEDFKTKEADRIADFNLKQLREFEDYQIDRRRLIEDFDNNQAQRAEQEAERRVELEEKTRDRLAEVTEKWDEILLRLRIGGDVDSIRLAEQKRAEALAEAQTEAQSDLAQFEEQSRRRREIEREELDLRLQRLEEDFNLRDQRRTEDFERELAERKAAFEAEQAEQLANFQKKREEDQKQFALDQLERKAELNRKLNDLRGEIAELLGARELSANEEANLVKRAQHKQTQIVSGGKDDRADVIRQEQALLASFITGGAPPIADSEQALQDQLTNILLNGSNTRLSQIQFEQDRINELIAGHQAILAFAVQNQDPGGGVPRRAFGGTVPGALGSPQLVLAHGGERITPPATASYFSNVRQGDQVNINAPVSFSNNVNSDAIAHRVSQRAARELGRTIAARRAFGG